ncbi:MAG: PAS domain S-box protein, partial [Proteobacteria bacterium]|nr:PAS domain S-box protein [Pseudomonadota bacterium]
MAEKPTYEELEKKIQKLERTGSEYNKVKKKLHEEKTFSRALLLTAPVFYVAISVDGKTIMINDTMLDALGYKQDEVAGKDYITTFVPKRNHAELSRVFDRLVKFNKPTLNENYILAKNGKELLVEWHGKSILNKKGHVSYFFGVGIDITARKKRETAYRENEQRLKAIFEANPDPVVVYDMKGHPLYLNLAFTEVFGWLLNDLKGNCIPFVPEDQENLTKAQIKEIYESGNPVRFETKRLTKHGKTIDVLMSAAIIKDIQGINTGLVVNLRDITGKKRLEAQLLRAQRMETIGTLAGGIAHDFNNILSPILSHTEMLLHDTQEDRSIRNRLNQIHESTKRAISLVKQILTFSRQDNFCLKLIEIAPIIKEALSLIRSTIPTTIGIEQDIDKNCGYVKGDPTQIHQIVMNLATNAYHAMEETSGELKVSLKEVKLNELDSINLDIGPGLYGCLTVADTGGGMDKDIIEKIFDPFFTTKKIGKGTGMGLSVVHGIVKHMNGAIKVYSEPGKGSKFTVYFPLEKGSLEKQKIQENELMPSGIERILLVDDEESVAIIEKQILERLGYQVASFINSVEALDAFRAAPDKFDLIITDMAMPIMPGDKLSAALIGIRPDIPILLCTG